MLIASLACLRCGVAVAAADSSQINDHGPQPQLIEKELPLSVDPTTNTASGLIHLSNPTDKEISLSLSADDFKSATTGYGLNTKVVFAAPLET
ncbi:MAG TPA: hypothetical protein VGU64_23620, partial [Terriglobales bacterium]|nr:hypothetical protein [Terriglobales bacterium]